MASGIVAASSSSAASLRGERTVLNLVGEVSDGLTGMICLAIDSHQTLPLGSPEGSG